MSLRVLIGLARTLAMKELCRRTLILRKIVRIFWWNSRIWKVYSKNHNSSDESQKSEESLLNIDGNINVIDNVWKELCSLYIFFNFNERYTSYITWNITVIIFVHILPAQRSTIQLPLSKSKELDKMNFLSSLIFLSNNKHLFSKNQHKNITFFQSLKS